MSKKQQTSSNELHEFIMKTIVKEKPETTEELLSIISQKYPSTPEENKNALEKLEAGNKIQFTKEIPSQPPKLKKLTFLHRALWFWLTLAISIVTVIAVFAIPQDAYPLTYLRQVLGTVFVLFLPGLVFVKTLFPSNLPIATSSENLDALERITLSFGLSITLVAMTGLALNYTPWGIRLTPIAISLLAFTLIFGVVAVSREYQAKIAVK